MNAINFTKLAREMLGDYLNDDGLLNAGSEGLIGFDEEPGALDLAVSRLDAGDLIGALQKLDGAERICREPVAPPTTGRNRLEEHQWATRSRARILCVTQIARVLVLDALKAQPLNTPEA